MDTERSTLLKAHDRALAMVAGVTTLGIMLFWANWFLSSAFRSEGSECYRVFENTFPPSDFVLAAMLALVALGLWRGAQSRMAAGLAVGMLLHLSSLELLWHGLGIFTTGMNPPTAFIVAITFILAIWILMRFAREPRGGHSPTPLRRAGAMLIVAAYVAFTLAYWWMHYRGPHASSELDPCAQTFTSTFWLADLLGCLFGVWALLATPFWSRSARFANLAVAGGMFFGTMSVVTFVLLEAGRVGTLFSGYLVVGAAFFVACGALIACVAAPRA